MSERDETTGQFTSAEPVYGQASVERDQGYVPYKEESTEEPEELTVREAAEQYNSRTAEADIRTHSPIDLPENVTLTVDQAHKIRSDMDAADAAELEAKEDDKFRAEIDELRGVKTEPAAEPATTELTPEKIAEHPAFKETVEKLTSETETTRQAYNQSIELANRFARAAFIEDFPDIAAMPIDQWQNALAAMAQQQPERFSKAMGKLNRVAQLEQAQQFQQQQRALAERQEFDSFAKTQDAAIDEMMKGESPQSQKAIMDEIVSGAKDAGMDQAEFLKMFGTERVMRHSAFQKMMVDAAKYRLMQKAGKALATKPIPPVQRPGVARSAGERKAADLGALRAKLSQSGSVDDAFNLYVAEKAARRR